MKGKRLLGSTLAAALVLVLMAGLALAQTPTGSPVGTAFTYQGQLKSNGAPYTGTCDLRFKLYDDPGAGSQIGPTQTKTSVGLTDGYLTVQLDFGSGAFAGDARWLNIEVCCPTGNCSYEPLTPRQALTAAPQAQYAKSAPWSGLSGMPAGFSDGVDNDTLYSAGTGLTLSGTTFSADTTYLQRRVSGTCTAGNAIRVVNADGTVTCQAVDANAWLLTGNAGTTPPTNFLGTTDDTALVLKVNGARALRLEPNATSPNLIGGYKDNSVTDGAYGAAIGGGGQTGYANLVTDNSGTVGGGLANQAGDNAGTVFDAADATVGGGGQNVASGLYATVGGGGENAAIGSAATVAGGGHNAASGAHAMVPGGEFNTAQGNKSFAAGFRAKATSDGSFVWADSTDVDFADVGPNTFNVRAERGAYILADNPGYGLTVYNDAHDTNGDAIDAWASTSQGDIWAAVFAYNDGTSPALYASGGGTYAGIFLGQIYTTGCVGCLLIQLGQNDGAGVLQPGDLAAVSGLAAPLAGSGQPILAVHSAAEGEAVVGVVQVRGVRAESTKDGKTLESVDRAEGDVQPGDYLFLVVYGPAQVKADASAGAIAIGTRLTAGQAGHARALQTRTIDGMVVAEAAPGVGIALEALDSGTGLISVFVTLNQREVGDEGEAHFRCVAPESSTRRLPVPAGGVRGLGPIGRDL